MPGSPADSDELSILRRKRDEVDEHIGQIQQRIRNLAAERERHSEKRNFLTALIAEAHAAGAQPKIPSGWMPTRKNRRVLVAWGMIYDALENVPGLSQQDLFSAVKLVLPNLKDGTFRSYLHRFKKEHLIEKSPGSKNWRLLVHREKEGEDELIR